MDAITAYRPRLKDALTAAADDIALPGLPDEDVTAFLTGGKLLRGSLLLWTHDAYGGGREDAALQAATALELLHSGLLIHDDIVDRDDRRRGMPTLEARYRDEAADGDADDPDHVARSQALCAADCLYFTAMQRLSRVARSAPDLAAVFGEVFADVARAEMREVRWAAFDTSCDEEDILSLYQDKTARYSVALPLQAGGVLADAPRDDRERLVDIGMELGVVYQLTDDEIGMLGDPEQTGKPVGTDFVEGRQTMHYLRLIQAANTLPVEGPASDGAGSAAQTMVEEMRQHDVIATVREEMQGHVSTANKRIDQLSLEAKQRQTLASFGRALLNRNQ